MRKETFSSKIIGWYQTNHRNLPWRQTTDPYKIWLSEVMLQQTRVAQGLPYYERFIKSFPTIFDLASASEQNVLRLWQGLGYYSRARNLHRCARVVVENFNGNFPTSLKELIKLPGVGDYTGAAIASIAFREPVAVVDGNVFRVLARIFGIETDIASNEGKKYFFSLATQLIDKNRPDLFNQAMMEFGALHCLPKKPKCSGCIFSISCEAYQKNLQSVLPLKSNKVKIKTRYFYYFIVRNKKKILMKQRTEKDIWRGLNDFYLRETERRQKPEVLIRTDRLLANSVIVGESKPYKHMLTHQKLVVRFITTQSPMTKKMELVINKMGLKWFSKRQIEAIPKPILIDRFLKEKIHDQDFW
jgi:A/G-specific adenine glycosylase